MSTGSLSVVAGGRAVGGWETLWERDEWPFEELPHADLNLEQHEALRFDRIAQRWMREAAKRWARLLRATSPATMRVYLGDLSLFSGWVAERAPEVHSPALITRALLEDYLLWVRTGDRSASTGRRYVCVVRQFLAEQCDDGLVGLPRGAVIHGSEMPDVAYRPPRGLEPWVFEQFIDPANLALLGNEQQRTVILLLAHTGLRVSSVVTLTRDALEIGSDDHPYLRYLNVKLKLKREAMIPIGPVLAEQIRLQQRYLDAAYGPDGTRFLLPSPPEGRVGWSPGRGGGCHIAKHTVGHIVSKYVRRAEIRGSDGQLATGVHPHLFRHHLGASLVNDGVALPVIQRVLDHESIEMTARYAHVADETVERELARWRERVNIRGERIALPVDGPLAQAAWMKDRISRAKQALPNGYCGLPLVQTCPHPNACLSCDQFLTDPSYREIHEDQLTQTRRLKADAEHGGQVRLVELLAGDEAALARILAGLDELEADARRADPRIDLIEIAQQSS
jgi:site-specific recombinase XerD